MLVKKILKIYIQCTALISDQPKDISDVKSNMLNVDFNNDIPADRETICYIIVSNCVLHYEPTKNMITPKI